MIYETLWKPIILNQLFQIPKNIRMVPINRWGVSLHVQHAAIVVSTYYPCVDYISFYSY